MPLPVWVPGEVMASSDVNSYFVPQAVVKASTTARPSNTTITADPALTVTLAAGGLYEIRCMVYFAGGNAVGYLQWNWTTPGSGFFSYLATYAAQGGGVDAGYSNIVAGVQLGAASVVGPAWTSGTGTPWCVFMTGLANGGTGGALTFNWAQASSNATATSVLSNSYIVATRIAT
jgi:hypothetical protein